MGRKEKQFHFIYKTTDLRNGNFYIGMHSTDKLDDGYIGSGKRLKQLIHKHGKEIFNMEILEFFPDRKSLRDREIEIVNSDLLLEDKCMNLKPGGYGGGKFKDKEHQFKCSQAAGLKHGERMKNDIEYRLSYSKKISEANKRGFKQNNRRLIKDYYSWEGKKHKPETIEKLRNIKKGTGVGESNSQYGTRWITNGVVNKKIKGGESVPDNWWYGVSKTNSQ
jgi:hypothetical protein